jgi:hypothetical protein
MSDDQTLAEFWRIRNAAAATLALTEEQMRRAVQAATVEQLAALFEAFSPARSTGPEWTRTFDPLVEHLWTWRDSETIAAVAEAFRARGIPWASVANALSPERGGRVRAATPHPSWARQPAFGLV